MTTDITTRSIRPSSAAPNRWFLAAALTVTIFASSAFAQGEETFKAKCVACHGADGSGNTAMGKKFNLRDLRSAGVQSESDAALTAVITNGKPPMPAFGKTLDAAAITGLVTYIRSIAAK
jgi:cytochrome c6